MAKHRDKISRRVRLAVYERDDWTCQYCARRFKPAEGGYAPYEHGDCLEIDHIRPIKHGGTNDFGNLQAACSPCNRIKSAWVRQSDWKTRFEVARVLIAAREPSERSAEVIIGTLLGRPFTMKEVRQDGA